MSTVPNAIYRQAIKKFFRSGDFLPWPFPIWFISEVKTSEKKLRNTLTLTIESSVGLQIKYLRFTMYLCIKLITAKWRKRAKNH